MNSTRKERKRGMKRGPYQRKKMRQYETDEDEGSPPSGHWTDDESTVMSKSRSESSTNQNILKIRLTNLAGYGKSPDQVWRGDMGVEEIDGSSREKIYSIIGRPIRVSRNRSLSYYEHSIVPDEVIEDRTQLNALAKVCSAFYEDLLTKEHPPIVTYINWPPTFDPYFSTVQFGSQQERNVWTPVSLESMDLERRQFNRTPAPTENILPTPATPIPVKTFLLNNDLN